MAKEKDKPECGAWVELPCHQPATGPAVTGTIVKCQKGKHRGKDHRYSFEFFIEDHEGDDGWRFAHVEWRL
jgi:hypothetical protein